MDTGPPDASCRNRLQKAAEGAHWSGQLPFSGARTARFGRSASGFARRSCKPTAPTTAPVPRRHPAAITTSARPARRYSRPGRSNRAAMWRSGPWGYPQPLFPSTIPHRCNQPRACPVQPDAPFAVARQRKVPMFALAKERAWRGVGAAAANGLEIVPRARSSRPRSASARHLAGLQRLQESRDRSQIRVL